MTSNPLLSEIQRILHRYFEDLETVLKEEGLGETYRRALLSLGLDSDLSGPLDFESYFRLLEVLDAQSCVPGLGLKVGAMKSHGIYGLSGMSLVTQGTLEGVARGAQENSGYAWGSSVRFRMRIEGAWFIHRYEMHPERWTRLIPLAEQVIMTGYRMLSEADPGLDWSQCRALFTFDAPSYAHLYGRFLPFEVAFSQDWNELWIPASWLDRPSCFANSSIQAFCAGRLEVLHASESGGLGLDRRLRQLLEGFDRPYAPTLPELTRQLGVSARLLQADLEKAATSFRAIQLEVVMARARDLLRDPRLSVKEVAFKLGFAHSASFCRAFARETGQTPTQFRSSQGLEGHS